MQTILTLDSAYRHSVLRLSSVHEQDEARKIADMLLEDIFGINKLKRLTDSDKPFKEFQRLELLLDRLVKGEPYQYLRGFTLFCNKRILVSDAVLIPRPETEELFYWMCSRLSFVPETMADICTGSGCLAIAMRDYFTNSKIIACDISIDALNKAILSERVNFISNTIEWHLTDILTETWKFDRPQAVISNPPYILESEAAAMNDTVLKFEPEIALFAKGNDPLVFYKRIIDLFADPPVPEIYFELNPLTAEDLGKYCKQRGLNIEFGNDMSGKVRFARIWH